MSKPSHDRIETEKRGNTEIVTMRPKQEPKTKKPKNV